jgi:hypothetical protein
MKRTIILGLFFLLSVTALANTAVGSRPGDASFNLFWQKFKMAVIQGNKAAVASMSSFPVEMSYGIPSIRNRSQMLRRYREVFKQQTDAAQCFSKKQPEVDPQEPKRFSIACPDAGGNEVVIYAFLRTRWGWKFVGLDNINE